MFIVFSLWVPDTFLTVGHLALAGVATRRSLHRRDRVGAFRSRPGCSTSRSAPRSASARCSSRGCWPRSTRRSRSAIVLTLARRRADRRRHRALIVRVRIPSFIATLGISSMLLAMIAWISNSQQILEPAGLVPEARAPTSCSGSPTPSTSCSSSPSSSGTCSTVRRSVAASTRPAATSRRRALAGVRTSRIVLFATITCGVDQRLRRRCWRARSSATGDPTIGPGVPAARRSRRSSSARPSSAAGASTSGAPSWPPTSSRSA